MAKKSNPAAAVLDVLLSLALVAGVGYCGYYVAANGVTIDQKSVHYTPEEAPTEPPADENSTIYGNEEFPNSEVHTGPLILVNNSTACNAVDENGLISLGIRKLELDNHSFNGVKDNDLLVSEDTANALFAMFDAFNAATGDAAIVVDDGYRSQEKQQEMYDNDLASTGLDYSDLVAKPGYSEHQTGLAVDLGLVDGDYDGTGVYEWLDDHCADYGIILRYPENKQDITGIRFEPWHYRYVGIPHASVIMDRGICLEEYIDLVKEYPYDGEHLLVNGPDDKIYEIYYYQEDTAYDSTMVPVPGGGLSYTVNGNNVDGFIIAVDTGETGPVSSDMDVPEEGDAFDEENVPEDNAAPEGEEVPEEDAAE